MPENKPIKSLILTVGPPHEKPWWWKYIEFDTRKCEMDYKRISFGDRKPSELSILQLPKLFVNILIVLLKSEHDFVFTFECGWESAMIALLQTMTFRRSPKHVILQFIMREKQNNLKSRLKYLVMRVVFSSLYLVICSSKSERDYYKDVFGWNESQIKYVPVNTDPNFMTFDSEENGNYIFAAGRTFRDYKTFFSAVEGLDVPVIVVASPQNIGSEAIPRNVIVKYDIDMKDLIELMQNSLLVVVPLEDRKISIGQSVLLQAMAMGKTVVATRTNGTIDYIDHMVNGVLVEAKSKHELRTAIVKLVENDGLREILGKNARKSVENRHLPKHYFKAVSNIVRQEIILSIKR